MRSLPVASVFLGLVGAIAAQTNFPPPPAPAGNPVTPDKALLGMALFFEEQLSSTGTVACASCHDLGLGGVDARAASHRNPGFDGRFGTPDDVQGSPGVPRAVGDYVVGSVDYGFGSQVTSRRAPSVLHSGYHTHLFYDGRAERGNFLDPETGQVALTGPVALENLVAQPPINPVEMGHAGRRWGDVAAQVAAAEPLLWAANLPPRLQAFVQGQSYPQLFQRAFGSPGVTPVRIVMAIATYLRTLNADQTPWDQHLAGNHTLTPQQAAGLALFRSPRQGAVACNTCHGDFEPRVRTEGPMAGQMTSFGVGPYSALFPVRLLFHNVGARPAIEDPGRGTISGLAAEFGKFRVPSLRNVALAAPYFHNGSKATLRDVIDFYDRGGDFHANQSPGLLVRQYTPAEKAALEALLQMLTDPRVAAGLPPFDRPRLGSESGNLPTAIGPGSPLGDRRARAHAPLAPRVGETRFSILLDGVSPGAFTMLMWDTDVLPGAATAANYYFVLATTPAFACFPIGPAAAELGTGVQRVSMPLPAWPSLRGVVLYTQWLVLEPSGSYGLATSNGLRLQLR